MKPTVLVVRVALGPQFDSVANSLYPVVQVEAVHAQIEEVKATKPYHTFSELLETNDTWEIK